MLTDRAGPTSGLVTLQLTPQWTGHRHGHRRDRRHAGTTSAPRSPGPRAGTPDVPQDWVEVQARGHRDPGGARQPAAHQRQHRRHAHARRPDDRRRASASGCRSRSRPARPTLITKYVGRRLLPGRTRLRWPPRRTRRRGRPRRPGVAAPRQRRRLGGVVERPDRRARQQRRWPPTSTPASSTCGRARAPASTGACRPAGLSSNGYDGHIFWDAETWMYPSLLAQHPDRRRRHERLPLRPPGEPPSSTPPPPATQGARFPWESALDGTEQIPPPVSVNSEGLFEQHITADIALGPVAVLPGDRRQAVAGARGLAGDLRRRRRSGPRARSSGSDGQLPPDRVTGPDEENPDVNDEAYTNVAAPRDAAGRDPGGAGARAAPLRRSWSTIASGLIVLDRQARRDPSRVQRLRRPAGQAGRRDAAAVPVGVPDVAAGRPERPGLLHGRAATPAARR